GMRRSGREGAQAGLRLDRARVRLRGGAGGAADGPLAETVCDVRERHQAITSCGSRVGAPSRSIRWSPTRSAFAIAVSAGLTAVDEGKKLVSTTYRLSTSCALQFTSSADVVGSLPNRTVPHWCATPASGIRPSRINWFGTSVS